MWKQFNGPKFCCCCCFLAQLRFKMQCCRPAIQFCPIVKVATMKVWWPPQCSLNNMFGQLLDQHKGRMGTWGCKDVHLSLNNMFGRVWMGLLGQCRRWMAKVRCIFTICYTTFYLMSTTWNSLVTIKVEYGALQLLQTITRQEHKRGGRNSRVFGEKICDTFITKFGEKFSESPISSPNLVKNPVRSPNLVTNSVTYFVR